MIIFLESGEEIIQLIKEQIRSGYGRIRKMGTDYLFYSIIDLFVDYNFNVLEALVERIEQIEEEVVSNPT